MEPQVCVFSAGLTSKMISDTIKAIKLPAQFIFHEMVLNENVKLPERLNRCDVFLSSGSNAQILKSKTDKPVITISPSIYDILLACSKAVQFCEQPLVIAYKGDFDASHLFQLSRILAVDIQFETYDRADSSVEQIVLRYKEKGQRCVIGSGLVCGYAEKHGMHGIYLFPRESIRNSLETAADLAVSICQKTSQNLQLSSIVNNSKQGILFADSRGTIFLCNPVALEYLKAKEQEVVGERIGRFFPQEEVREMFSRTGNRRFFCKIQGSRYVVETIPVISKNEVSNLLLYLDDVDEIQKTDRDIRREVWSQKGFVAKYTFDQYESVNPAFLDFLALAKGFARSDEPVVILGETGTGKEVLAQSIHNHSRRVGKAFVAVNCAAIPENLLESELFGYSEGAFTGAKKGGKEGYFEMAHMGTIFLDEIGEMNPLLQSKLLRVIQEKQVLRVGGTKLIPFDARIIVATNRNLWELVRQEAFRKDLYYRLNVLELEIPPLRERAEDILPLFQGFLHRLEPEAWEQLAPLREELETLLTAYSWPGNVRELENFAHMLAASWQPEDPPRQKLAVLRGALSSKRRHTDDAPLPAACPPPTAPRQAAGPVSTIKSSEEEQIRAALAACGGNCTKAAELLGIHRITLWRKLKRNPDL